MGLVHTSSGVMLNGAALVTTAHIHVISDTSGLQAALDAKLTGPLSKSDVGLGNVDNTSDVSKPVSTAQQNALNLKANLAGPTFTGTVSGITATMVGLGSVNNTSDANKPISTATQTALDAKQATLVSGTSIKTINGSTVLGSGNLAVSAGDPSYSPGSFTVSTETGKYVPNHLKLTTTQRATIQGTGRLRMTN